MKLDDKIANKFTTKNVTKADKTELKELQNEIWNEDQNKKGENNPPHQEYQSPAYLLDPQGGAQGKK